MTEGASKRIEIETLNHIRIKSLATAAGINFVAVTVENNGVANGTAERHRISDSQIGETKRNKVGCCGRGMLNERNADV